MKRWEQGRTTIETLLERGDLERVSANAQWAHALIDLAEEQLRAARAVLEISALTAFQTTYDAVHKMFDAILVNQGLRGTSRGGHLAIRDALRAQLDPPMSDLIADFDWMRRMRNAGDYPVPDKKLADRADANEALTVGDELASKVRALLAAMPPFGT